MKILTIDLAVVIVILGGQKKGKEMRGEGELLLVSMTNIF
jgi:hypothetical protein